MGSLFSKAKTPAPASREELFAELEEKQREFSLLQTRQYPVSKKEISGLTQQIEELRKRIAALPSEKAHAALRK